MFYTPYSLIFFIVAHMKTLFVILSLLAGTILPAQQLQTVPLITVTGEAVIKTSPDYVILGLRIKKELLPNMENKLSQQIFKEEDTKIRLFDFNEADMSKSIIQFDSSTYYKEVFITITDIKKLDKYLLELFNMGYRDYIYVEYRSSNYSNLKTQARKDAINAARKKAQVLAAELGQTIGKAYTIEDLSSEEYNWYQLKDKTGLENITFKTGADGYLVEPGYITVTSKVKVSFNLP